MPNFSATTSSTTVVPGPPGINFEGLFRALFEGLTNGDPDAFMAKLGHWWDIYSIIAILLSLVFFVGFVYAKIRYNQLYEIEMERIKEEEAKWVAKYDKSGSKNARWDAIQRRVAENNPEAWRISIIEADIFLDEILTKAGYVGKSIGEKLKTANPQSFTTVQDAWNAHKVRNDIAHVGSDFILTKRSAQETLVQYERVFREFGAI